MPSLAAFAAPAALAPGSWNRRAQCARSATHTRVARVRCAVPVTVGADDFGSEVLQAEGPVLVDFHASWCGPCKLMSPLMDWAASEYAGKLKVVKVDTELNTVVVKEYGIHGLPTFAVFRDGQPSGVQEGAMGKQGLLDYIVKHVPECGK